MIPELILMNNYVGVSYNMTQFNGTGRCPAFDVPLYDYDADCFGGSLHFLL